MTIDELIKEKFKYHIFLEKEREIEQDSFCYIWKEEGVYVIMSESKCFYGQIYGRDIDNIEDLLEMMPPILQKRRDDRIDEILS